MVGSDFELNPDAVNDTLQRLKMPESAGPLQVVGMLASDPAKRPISEGGYTYHYLPALPKNESATAAGGQPDVNISLTHCNRKAAAGLMDMVDFHREIDNLATDPMIPPASKKIGGMAVASFTLFTANTILVSAGAEAADKGYIGVPVIFGMGATAYYAFNRYRERVHEAEDEARQRAMKERELMIDFIATGTPLVIHRGESGQ